MINFQTILKTVVVLSLPMIFGMVVDLDRYLRLMSFCDLARYKLTAVAIDFGVGATGLKRTSPSLPGTERREGFCPGVIDLLLAMSRTFFESSRN